MADLITLPRETVQQAIDRLNGPMDYYQDQAVITALRTALEAAPAARESLTDEQIATAANSVRWSNQYHIDFARAIEAAHGITQRDGV